jgi:hypothetical protein
MCRSLSAFINFCNTLFSLLDGTSCGTELESESFGEIEGQFYQKLVLVKYALDLVQKTRSSWSGKEAPFNEGVW